MKLAELFTDFDAWVEHALGRGFEGPKQLQGHQQFEFTENGQTVARWDGITGNGSAVPADDPAPAEPTPAPEAPTETNPEETPNVENHPE